jgi:hypothetical protein
MMLKIFETKIFPIHKLSFMQYLPIFIISLSHMSDYCKIFAEKFLSFLIFKAFNIGSKEHLSVRQQSWNYLSSLLSRQNTIIKEPTVMKSIRFILKYFQQSMKVKSPRTSMYGQSPVSVQTQDTEMELSDSSSHDRIFTHCFVQGLALIMVTQYHAIKQHDDEIFNLICKILFKKNFSSLTYCSPLILSDLLNVVNTGQYNLHFFQRKVKEAFKQQ